MLIPYNEERDAKYWRTRKVESILIATIVVSVLAVLLRDTVALSTALNNENSLAGLRTSPWNADWKVDLNDGQLKSFREGLALLTLVAGLFVLLRRTIRGKGHEFQLFYYIVFGLGMGLYLHGPGIIFLLVMILCNYYAVWSFGGRKWFPLCIWAGNLFFLVSADYYRGFKLAWFFPALQFLDSFAVEMK